MEWGFYAWRSQEESLREKDDQEMGPLVDEIFWHHRRRYGARRISVELSRRGMASGVARVARLLKTRGLQAIQPKSFRPRSTESRHRLAELFGVQVPGINKHLKNIFESGELNREATVSKMEIVRSEGDRDVAREVEFYNLDAIIAVGYRVNSYQATQFRIWATKTLREFIIKGFVLDDERLKQGKQVFGKDYFDELLERIREIRASERRFYQKITDIYALSVDSVRLHRHCLAELQTRTAERPQPPADWSRDAKLDCKCADCRELAVFLKN